MGLLLFVWLGLVSANAAETRRQLADGWEFHQGSLGSTWEIWRDDTARPISRPAIFYS
jgi:hypothetical protein